jgi:DNA-binding CsgD family transcriptional regulator
MVDHSLADSDHGRTDQMLVGRTSELAEIDRFLDRSQRGLHGLLLSGPAGIGKTTLWKAALSLATERGYRVLACRPTEVETQLSFAALVDLLGEVADEFLPQLPEPQRVAVDAALLRGTTEAVPAPLGVSLGVLGIVRAAAEAGPVLIAIDDVPWLDDSSAQALSFALRRLEDSPVALLAAQRTDGSRLAIPELIAAVGAGRHSSIEVAPLTFDDTAEVVQRVLGVALRRPTLVHVHELSGGNAFYALEVARAIERRTHPGGHDDIQLPESLEDLIRDRIDALPAASLEVALYAAALSQPTRDVLVAALGADAVEAGLAAGIAAGVVDAEGEAIRFSHPLLAAAIYGRASQAERRILHRTLAGVVHEPEERAIHLAVATEGPDAEIATALEDAARTARARGAAGAAAELAEAAIRLTPADQTVARRRRTMATADYQVAAGDVPRARATLENLAAETPEAERGAILAELGHLLLNLSDRPAAGSVLEKALALVGNDLALRTHVEMGLAGVAFLTWEDWPSGERHIAAALAAAEELGDPVVLLQAIGHYATWEFSLGRGVPRDLMERAARLDRWRDDVPFVEHPDAQFVAILAAIGETDDARRRQERLLADARNRGAWSSLPWLYLRMAGIEVTAGHWDLAQVYASDCRTTAAQSGQDPAAGYIGNIEVELQALRGDVPGCRTSAERQLRIAEQMGLPDARARYGTSLGLLELSLGNAGAAWAQLEPALDNNFPGQAEAANQRPTVPLAVEALIGLSRLAEAEALLDPYEQLARRQQRTISMADAAHCRGLLLAAQGDLEAGLASAEEALRLFESLPLPFETARTLLALGEIRRRARKKAAARDAVGRALAIFERLGADRWADRARAELGRSGVRRAPGAELTETEMRVAELASAGQTNREIADGLFMSVHTVEAHLTRIYRTLGVHTRTELARHRFDRASPD